MKNRFLSKSHSLLILLLLASVLGCIPCHASHFSNQAAVFWPLYREEDTLEEIQEARDFFIAGDDALPYGIASEHMATVPVNAPLNETGPRNGKSFAKYIAEALNSIKNEEDPLLIVFISSHGNIGIVGRESGPPIRHEDLVKTIIKELRVFEKNTGKIPKLQIFYSACYSLSLFDALHKELKVGSHNAPRPGRPLFQSSDPSSQYLFPVDLIAASDRGKVAFAELGKQLSFIATAIQLAQSSKSDFMASVMGFFDSFLYLDQRNQGVPQIRSFYREVRLNPFDRIRMFYVVAQAVVLMTEIKVGYESVLPVADSMWWQFAATMDGNDWSLFFLHACRIRPTPFLNLIEFIGVEIMPNAIVAIDGILINKKASLAYRNQARRILITLIKKNSRAAAFYTDSLETKPVALITPLRAAYILAQSRIHDARIIPLFRHYVEALSAGQKTLSKSDPATPETYEFGQVYMALKLLGEDGAEMIQQMRQAWARAGFQEIEPLGQPTLNCAEAMGDSNGADALEAESNDSKESVRSDSG